MDISDFNFGVSTALSPDDDAQVKNWLRTFNEGANSELWAKVEDPQHAAQPLCVAALDIKNQIVGGLLATTSFSWLKIDIMAVIESHRRFGLGSQMLQAAEQEATRRRCKYAFCDTMDYQAPGFYVANGYIVAGTIDDWDSHGHAKYFLTKKLAT